LAIAPLLGSLHRASVRHTVCEHGDLIEPEPGGLRDSPAADGMASSAVSALQVDFAAALHVHTHCSAGMLAKNAFGLVARAGVLACAVLVAPAEHLDPPVGYVRHILLNAPKTSPPSRRADVPV
jgi:hypothetical protein